MGGKIGILRACNKMIPHGTISFAACPSIIRLRAHRQYINRPILINDPEFDPHSHPYSLVVISDSAIADIALKNLSGKWKAG